VTADVTAVFIMHQLSIPRDCDHWRKAMRQTAVAILALVIVLNMCFFPMKLYGATDAYDSLQFFLDQALKRTEDSKERAEILNRYLIKSLGLLYEQNQELIRLQRQTLEALQELRDTEKKELRELEIQLHKSQ
jgi:hypothetical protein